MTGPHTPYHLHPHHLNIPPATPVRAPFARHPVTPSYEGVKRFFRARTEEVPRDTLATSFYCKGEEGEKKRPTGRRARPKWEKRKQKELCHGCGAAEKEKTRALASSLSNHPLFTRGETTPHLHPSSLITNSPHFPPL